MADPIREARIAYRVAGDRLRSLLATSDAEIRDNGGKADGLLTFTVRDPAHGRSCVSCAHWQNFGDPAAETCGQYGQRPPSLIIVVGCSGYAPGPSERLNSGQAS